jgi:hypothetical protein
VQYVENRAACVLMRDAQQFGGLPEDGQWWTEFATTDQKCCDTLLLVLGYNVAEPSGFYQAAQRGGTRFARKCFNAADLLVLCTSEGGWLYGCGPHPGLTELGVFLAVNETVEVMSNGLVRVKSSGFVRPGTFFTQATSISMSAARAARLHIPLKANKVYDKSARPSTYYGHSTITPEDAVHGEYTVSRLVVEAMVPDDVDDLRNTSGRSFSMFKLQHQDRTPLFLLDSGWDADTTRAGGFSSFKTY